MFIYTFISVPFLGGAPSLVGRRQQNILHFPTLVLSAKSRAASPKREKKVVIKTTKAKAKPKAKRYTHAHKDVKLTTQQWAVWVAVKALLNAKGELASEGFYSLSGQFVAQFIGLPYWEKREVNRVNSVMACLRRKGLLTWVNEKVGKRGHKIKGGIAFGPKA